MRRLPLGIVRLSAYDYIDVGPWRGAQRYRVRIAGKNIGSFSRLRVAQQARDAHIRTLSRKQRGRLPVVAAADRAVIGEAYDRGTLSLQDVRNGIEQGLV